MPVKTSSAASRTDEACRHAAVGSGPRAALPVGPVSEVQATESCCTCVPAAGESVERLLKQDEPVCEASAV